MPETKTATDTASLAPDFRDDLDRIIAPYRNERGALIAVLQKVQEKLGYLPEPAIAQVAKAMRLSESEVFGVATFYNFFRLKPVGARLVQVCRGTACHVRGGPRILESVKKHLGIGEGQTTADLKYSLETVACIGACALAPNIVINNETYGRMTSKKVAELLGEG
ncbi:MAG: NADH-quinone oxidoreductase subunit NuoE [Chloroflexi bacterium]|nr:NADH-quinone oxidoreductase subunit NuoE [Chloroflexota bacterium]